MATPLDLAPVEALVYPTLQAMPRIAAVFAVLPFMSGTMLAGAARGGIVLVLAAYLGPAAGPVPGGGIAAWILIAGKEALIGLLLGLGFGVPIWAVQSMGDLIDVQTGSSNADFFDPVGGHEGGRTGEFLGWLVGSLFVVGGGLLALVGALHDSFRLWPAASFSPRLGEVLQAFVIQQGDNLFAWTLKLAMPVVMVLLLAELGIGLVGRISPQLNVFVFAQPIKYLLAVLMLVLLLYTLYQSLLGFLIPENPVLRFLRTAL